MSVHVKIVYSFLALVVIVALFALFVTSAESNARERDCFEAGGKVVDGVCMPVDGAIELEDNQ